MDGKLDVFQAQMATRLSNALDRPAEPDVKDAIKWGGARRIFSERALYALGEID